MISIFDQEALAKRLEENNIPKFRMKQIYTEIFSHSIIDFQEITTLPLDLRTKLAESFQIIPFSVDSVHDNPDSTKIGFQLSTGSILETVVMYHYHQREIHNSHPDDHRKEKFLNRVTICISSQVGCPVGCIFCVTGKL